MTNYGWFSGPSLKGRHGEIILIGTTDEQYSLASLEVFILFITQSCFSASTFLKYENAIPPWPACTFWIIYCCSDVFYCLDPKQIYLILTNYAIQCVVSLTVEWHNHVLRATIYCLSIQSISVSMDQGWRLLSQFLPSVIFRIFSLVKTHVVYWIWRLDLTGIAAAQLRWYPSEIYVIKRIQQQLW